MQNRHNNIYELLRTNVIQNRFTKEIKGYHRLNEEYIKESCWEELNRNIICKICTIKYKSLGSHLSGKDITFDNYNISNKTAKIKCNIIKISSYRLTSVCDIKNCGIPKNIIDEIIKRDNSFDYYSLLAREERKNDINYFWYIIPKNHDIFNISKQKWEKKIGKKGKHKGKQTGWKGKYFDIIFSMSSQLWFHFNKGQIDECMISTIKVNRKEIKKNTYADIEELYTK